MSPQYPGNEQHRRVLRAIVDFYAGDARVLAIALFGSLARGNWDDNSDLDLDVTLADGITVDPLAELARLGEALGSLGERAIIIVPSGADSGDMVFASLLEISIRYHPLSATSPNIVESVRVLGGSLTTEAIRAAGVAHPPDAPEPLTELLGKCLRYALEVAIALRRGRPWMAVELLHRSRELLMDVFAYMHGGFRTPQTFEAQASQTLQARLGATLPQFSLASARAALLSLLDVLEFDLSELSAGQLSLTDAQREMIEQLRQRQANTA